VDGWLARIEQTTDGVQIKGDKQRVAYDHWFQQAAERREGRRGRLAEAEPLVPGLVWLALFLGGALIITYMCFYADPEEPAFVQALMMGAVTTMVVAGLLVVRLLNEPYAGASGSIKPTVMTMTLRGMEDASEAPGMEVARLCDEGGQPQA
jgi:vacuolar-type H+-ATPase subunit I/STV1